MLCRWTLDFSCSWPLQHTHSNTLTWRCQTHWKVRTIMQGGGWVGRVLGLVRRQPHALSKFNIYWYGFFNLSTQNLRKEEGNIKDKPWIIVSFRGGPSMLHCMLFFQILLQWFVGPVSFHETERAFSTSLRYWLDKESRKVLEDQGTHLWSRTVKRGTIGPWHQPERFHPGLISILERDAGAQAGNWVHQIWDAVGGLLTLHCKIKHLCELRPAFHQVFHELLFLKGTPSAPSTEVEFPSSDKFDWQFTNSIATCEAKDVIPVTVSAWVCVSLDMNCSTFFCKE